MLKRLLLKLAKNGLATLLNDDKVKAEIQLRTKKLNAAVNIPILTETQEQVVLDNVISAIKGVLLGI